MMAKKEVSRSEETSTSGQDGVWRLGSPFLLKQMKKRQSI